MSLEERGNMVRAVLVVSRHPGQLNRLDAYRDTLNRKLTGDHIEPRPAAFVSRGGLSVAVLNPSNTARMHGASVALGTLLEAREDWHVPRAPLPDGSYALLRADESYVELAADSVGSRTLWYVLTEHELIASSSQRAIVTLLGSFEPNRNALPWMLSSGTLGPTAGWDARLQRLQPGERLLLDRARWRLERSIDEVEFAADDSVTHDAHLERLHAAVEGACRRWSFQPRDWLLTLSGGVDSRSLLYLLRHRGIQTITWGVTDSTREAGNDARIARQLAGALGVSHRFFTIDPHSCAPEVVLERFLAAGEGRVARISGYVDGFRVWKTLFDEGCDGVIRGDEAFGSFAVSSPYDARYMASLTTLADFFSQEERETFELPEQPLPERLVRGRAESLADWRDRLYQQFRVPTLLAGLTDLKTAYVEVATPLLSRSVLACVRRLPDALRNEKRLWRDLVADLVPDVALATRVAIPSLTDFLADRRVLTLLTDELSSAPASSVFAPLLRTRLCAALRAAQRTAVMAPRVSRGPWRRSGWARAVPGGLRMAVRNWRLRRSTLEPLALAFRAFVATRMHALLREDAATRPAAIEPAISA
jgi:hypothetical protein